MLIGVTMFTIKSYPNILNFTDDIDGRLNGESELLHRSSSYMAGLLLQSPKIKMWLFFLLRRSLVALRMRFQLNSSRMRNQHYKPINQFESFIDL